MKVKSKLDYAYVILVLILLIFMIAGILKLDKMHRDQTNSIPVITKLNIIPMPRQKNKSQMLISSTDGSMNINFFVSNDELKTFSKRIKNILRKNK